MVELGQAVGLRGKPLPHRQEQLLEMVGLAEVRDDDDAVGVEVLEAVEGGGEVGGGVVAGAVGLAHDEGLGLEPRVFRVEDDERALAFRGEGGRGELAVHPGHLIVVEALAEGDVEPDPELVVDLLEGAEADVVDFLPDREVGRVAGLELHEFLAGLLEHGGVGLGGGIADLVEPFELLQRVGGERGGVEVALVGPDQLSKLGAPVANVVVAHDPGAAEFQQPADGLADDRRPQVADVHLLRGVGRGVVDHPGLAAAGGGGAGLEVVRGVVGTQPGQQGGGLQGEVDEAGAGDDDLVGGGQLGRQGGDEFFGEGAGVELAGLGVAEDPVGLEIAMAGVRRSHFGHEGTGLEPGGGGGGLEGRIEGVGEIERNRHPFTSQPRPGRAQAWIWAVTRREANCGTSLPAKDPNCGRPQQTTRGLRRSPSNRRKRTPIRDRLSMSGRSIRGRSIGSGLIGAVGVGCRVPGSLPPAEIDCCDASGAGSFGSTNWY